MPVTRMGGCFYYHQLSMCRLDSIVNANDLVSLFTAVTTVMVEIKQLDQFRWPGLFIAFVGVVYCGLFLLLFRSQRRPPKTNTMNTLSKEKCSRNAQYCIPYTTLLCKLRSPPNCKELFVS